MGYNIKGKNLFLYFTYNSVNITIKYYRFCLKLHVSTRLSHLQAMIWKLMCSQSIHAHFGIPKKL